MVWNSIAIGGDILEPGCQIGFILEFLSFILYLVKELFNFILRDRKISNIGVSKAA